MKVLFDHTSPFFLAHGGFQIQIEQTKAALEQNGVEVEYVRWWDESQRGDLIHFFGRPVDAYIHFAHQRNMKVVLAELLTGLGSRSYPARVLQKLLITGAQACLPKMFTYRMGWDCYRLADACVALTPWEKQLMSEIFSAPPGKVHCVPNGVEEVFFRTAPRLRGKWLVCTATITERKRVLELAEAAVLAGTPTWIVGRPYSESDPYAGRFLCLAREHPEIIRYEGGISDRGRLAEIYREARGFVLLSTMESLSLSALEAAACGCPLLLSDLPWARSTFAQGTQFCPIASASKTAKVLAAFYEAAPAMPHPEKPSTWNEIGKRFLEVYRGIVSISR